MEFLKEGVYFSGVAVLTVLIVAAITITYDLVSKKWGKDE